MSTATGPARANTVFDPRTNTWSAKYLPLYVDVTHDRVSGCWKVEPVWDGVDRPRTGGWSISGRALADRLANACRTGAAFTSTEVMTDVNGQTYVSAAHAVLSRRANADLRRLGY